MFCEQCGKPIPASQEVCRFCSVSAQQSVFDHEAIDKAKTVSKDATDALKIFVLNPVGGLAEAFDFLGEKKAFGVGLAFGVVFTLCVVIGTYSFLPAWGRPNGLGGFVKILLGAVIPFLGLWGANCIVRAAFQGVGSAGHDSFVAGATLLPLGFAVLLSGVLGFMNFEVILGLFIFAVSFAILMLFVGLTRVCNLSERLATYAVPIMVLITGVLAKIAYSILLK